MSAARNETVRADPDVGPGRATPGRYEVLKSLSIDEDSHFPGDRLDAKALAALPPGRLDQLVRGGWLRAASGGTS